MRPLIAANLAHGDGASPQDSNHTMDAGALTQADIAFWTVSDASGVLGCAGLKTLPDATAEVKSVYVAQHARRRGLARRMMMFLMDYARANTIRTLVLETGTMQEYQSARRLYQALGFVECGPVPGYVADPNSVFMRLALDPDSQSPQ